MTRTAGRVSRVELAFKNLRRATKKGNGLDFVQQRANELIDMLHADAMILSLEVALICASVQTALASDTSGLRDVRRIEAAASRTEAASRIESAFAGSQTAATMR